ncbi:polysaccharide biosynthesis tyrosine autokinase [Arthrobacter sp. GMC3]|uniref:polysaccharide biosynthesis tyrosine autokinase n=1 Tax=Arthrobacter sp. GMC3 TaxID=2058894 RepID=UPI000CE39C21|nr:polysaccharide biosynthesis tyrosine autokinase [Arthrobacter sp. GMC3]
MAAMKIVGTTRSARITSTLTKRWYVVILAAAIGSVGAFALSYMVTPIYTSSTSLFFSLRTGGTATDINQGSTYTQNQMLSFAQLAASSVVLDQVVKDLGPETNTNTNTIDLRRSITITTPQNTVIMDINVGTTDPNLSAKIANSVAKNLTLAVSTLSPIDKANQSGVVANIIEPAVPATFQSSPDKKKNAILGGFFGIAASILAITLTVAFDTKVRSVAALKSMTDYPLLGTVERNRASNDIRPVVLRLPNGPAAERFRQIRSGLRFAAASHEMRAMAITSAIPSEGKTLSSLNLALVMAESKERVLLIDADLRRPRIADSIGFEGTIGLTTVLVGDVSFENAKQRFGTTTLDILTAGATPPNPAELLGSTPMQNLIEKAKLEYDIVIIDTAPVLAVADVTVIAPLVDSIVLVVDSTKLRQAQLEQASEALGTAGAHVAGIILNRIKPSKLHDVYYRDFTGKPSHSKGKSRVTADSMATAGTRGTRGKEFE